MAAPERRVKRRDPLVRDLIWVVALSAVAFSGIYLAHLVLVH